MIQDTRPLIRVVAGILLDSDGNYLLGSRPEGKPYAGYWEFAGGKVEAGETDFQALQREFGEELGIRILAATPWLTKIHSYEHARVCLKFLWVNPDQWEGGPQSREGQEWSWQKAGDFTVAPMLPANGALLRSLSVPRRLYGSLKTGLHGENSMGAYRVLPLGSAGGSGANVLMEAAQWQDRSEHAGSVWMMVQTREQWRQARRRKRARMWSCGACAMMFRHKRRQKPCGRAYPCRSYLQQTDRRLHVMENYGSDWGRTRW